MSENTFEKNLCHQCGYSCYDPELFRFHLESHKAQSPEIVHSRVDRELQSVKAAFLAEAQLDWMLASQEWLNAYRMAVKDPDMYIDKLSWALENLNKVLKG